MAREPVTPEQKRVRIQFTPHASDGAPHLFCADDQAEASCGGAEINVVDTFLGRLVGIYLDPARDAWSRNFAFFVPSASGSSDLSTLGFIIIKRDTNLVGESQGTFWERSRSRAEPRSSAFRRNCFEPLCANVRARRPGG